MDYTYNIHAIYSEKIGKIKCINKLFIKKKKGMIYLHYYETESGFTEDRKNNYEEPWTSYTEDIDRVDYNDPYLKKPFTIKALGTGSVSWSLGEKNVLYSKNNGVWETMTSATTVPVSNGDEIHFKGENSNYSANTISSTTQFNIEGNIMSLIDADGFKSANIISSDDAFAKFFYNNTNLISAENLKLPAKKLTGIRCYYEMFRGCTGLVKGPELPAMELSDYCYSGIFNGCESLLVAPELPAMNLSQCCYSSAFTNCFSLQKAPDLPVEKLTNSCYKYMFDGCSGLTEVMETLPATTLTQYCYQYMFRFCSNITTAPVLPATSLFNGCYSYMFTGCSKLNYIKAMFTTKPTTTYTWGWVNNVASAGTFVKNSNATWSVSGGNGIPSGWTVQTATP